ncbi:pyridoxamine 5'-phosphate oxidase family protein [Janibacter terrae]|uniref:Pyridoxamine 5'-phosphate oxidase family protein n=1 Tax=Janibacter terrae TaxID=103817 RepID=A0ABZ2FFW1_9MICO|nr:pyridoxamine 5'-phosphate oxidase family protein [Janibacter terrae]MBA4085585.1 pyridoxamine 5'-phosphate oxidase family protein [Kytococcus sp.]HBO54755.1 pyridoxamine 5'-phosphate oxidase family protein [Janibacter terrae]
MTQSPIHGMSRDECWQELRGHEFGRLAFHLAGEVHIVPINYAIDREVLLFRTAQGNKLLGVVMQSDVAFEIDGYDSAQAWSVVVRGRARVLESTDDRERAEASRLRSWVPTDKDVFVEIAPEEISGRRFDLDKPWEHAIPLR